MNRLLNKSPQNKGQGMVEYIALTALVAIVCIGGVKVLGNKVRHRLTQITTKFDHNISQGLKRPAKGEDDGTDDSDSSDSVGKQNGGFGKSVIADFLGK